MQEHLFEQGFDLMLYGMGTVCVFLGVLVVATVAMSAFISKFFPVELVPVTLPSETKVTAVSDPKVLEIIQAAIKQHKNR